jgi:tRNA modification GTPase
VLRRARQGALLRDGIHVVLAGQPNVGKSSLLNALAGAELAIVTATPGTTRDKVGQTIQVEGVPIHVVDTAGLRDTTDEVERIGVARSWAEIESADALVFLHDLTRRGEAGYEAADGRIAARLPERLEREGRVVHVFNKLDLVGAEPVEEGLAISAATGEGLDRLRRKLLDLAGWQAAPEGLFIARARHVHALQRTRAHLDGAAAHAEAGNQALELLAEELRLAHTALAEITGAFTADDLLGAIFGRFCIGK